MATEPTAPRARKPRVSTRRSGFADWFRHLTNRGKAAIGILGAVGAVIVTGLTVDDRYARAGDVAGLRSSVDMNSLKQEIAIQKLRRAQVQDKLIDLQGKEQMQRGRLQPHERQALNRFAMEHGELTREIEDKQRVVDRASVRK